MLDMTHWVDWAVKSQHKQTNIGTVECIEEHTRPLLDCKNINEDIQEMPQS